jgi:hypothetical protein
LENKALDVFDQITKQLRTRISEESTQDINNSTAKALSPRSIPKNITSRGRVYFFRYTFPKTRNKLPYYHLFPCVYALNIESHYLTGLNLFYLPQKVRSLVLKRLKARVTSQQPFSRSLLDYDMMKKFKVLNAAIEPAIRKYDLRRVSINGLELSHELWDDFYLDDLSEVLEKAFLKKNYVNIQLLSRAKIIKNLLDTGGEEL